MNLPPNALGSVKSYFLSLQEKICHALESIDGHAIFLKDSWTHAPSGGGLTRVMNGGHVFEKAGVNFSSVSGHSLPAAASAQRPELAGCAFHATGVSLVVHPNNPYIPTTHANVRFFCAEKPNHDPIWWFGGGFDLTPYYGFEEDCIHWHQVAKKACDPFGEQLYPQLKSWCDRYFYMPHRQEARGIGGLFFDDFNEKNFAHSFDFTQSIGNHFLEAYIPIVKKRVLHPFSENEKNFQLHRRGRYVEFNLIYDRGTLFGLQSGGRTESILMSLPPEVRWDYQWHPEKDSKEARLYTDFLPARDWLSSHDCLVQ